MRGARAVAETEGDRSTSPPDLSDELLVSIFEQLLRIAPDEGSASLVPLLLVCKKWEPLARPLLFRDLTFTKGPRFAPIAKALEMALSQQKPAGIYIRTITINVSVDQAACHETGDESEHAPCPITSRSNTNLVRILCQATQLQSIHVKNACRPSLLSVLCLSSSNTIRTLDITVDSRCMRSETLPTITTSLNQLINLRCLSLASYTSWPKSKTPGLKLPSLHSFTWNSHHVTNPGASALFLDNCELAQLQNLTIIFWGEGGKFKVEATHSVRRFLELHSSIKSLALGFPNDQPSMAILPHLRPHISVLDYSIARLSPMLIPMLPKSVNTLKVSTAIDPEDDAWSALDQLASNETGVETVVINIWATEEGTVSFSWATGLAALTDPEQANSDIAVITGRMLAYSAKLASRGIKVVDNNGLAASVGLLSTRVSG